MEGGAEDVRGKRVAATTEACRPWKRLRMNEEAMFVEGEGSRSMVPANMLGQGPFIVTIPSEVVLKHMRARLGLDVRDYGVFPEEGGLYRAWLEMEVPVPGVNGAKGVEKFVGDECATSAEALDSVSQAAVWYLRKKCHVLVKDVNIEEVKAAESRARRAEEKVKCAQHFEELFYDMVLARDRSLAMAYQRQRDLSNELKSMVMDFGDILPVAPAEAVGASSSAGHGGIVYVGSWPPVRRLEHLALALLRFLDRACIPASANPGLF